MMDPPVVCHYGDGLSQLIRHPSRVERHLGDVLSSGYDAVRTWTVLGHPGFWKGREVGPLVQGEQYWEAVRLFAQLLQRLGLRWLVSQGDLCLVIPRQADRVAFMRRLGETLAPFGPLVLGVDAGNEAWQNGESNPDALRQLVDAFRWGSQTPIWSLTDGAGQETRDELLRYAGSVVDVHGYRGGRWWDKVRHIFTVAYETVPEWSIVQSEPFGPGPLVSVTEHKEELTLEVMQVAQMMASMTGQVWTYFSSSGIIADDWVWPVPVIRGVVSGGQLLHGGTRWAAKRIFEAVEENRADHVLRADGWWACLIYGPDREAVRRARPQRRVEIQEDRWCAVPVGGARYVMGRLLE